MFPRPANRRIEQANLLCRHCGQHPPELSPRPSYLPAAVPTSGVNISCHDPTTASLPIPGRHGRFESATRRAHPSRRICADSERGRRMPACIRNPTPMPHHTPTPGPPLPIRSQC
jgi:hypothetical protein